MPERLGILGGTFDPPHRGHLQLALAALATPLDRVMLVVAADPWQKSGEVVASAPSRLAMVQALVADHRGLEAGDLEMRRPGPTYTVDTLEELKAPDRELFLVLGADAAEGLDTWRQPERIRELATLLVLPRELPTSSTDARRRLAAGEPVDDLLTPEVIHLIQERRLYTRPSDGGPDAHPS